jgi:DNA-directed RNA polymerase specialized sigma24 family protein
VGGAPSLRSVRPFGPWFATIAIRVARDLERGRRRRPDGVSLGAAAATHR